MDNLTAKKKLQLFSDCLKAQDYVGLVHRDVKNAGSRSRNIERYQISRNCKDNS